MAETLLSKTKQLRTLFYLVTPNETSFEKFEDVPDYVTEVIPLFFTLVILERIILIFRGKSELRINDRIGSISAGIISETTKIVISTGIITIYANIYNNYRILELPWNSVWTWWLTFVAVDFAYYCFHRLTHEINIGWASHQVHHSSEDYNLTTALRQSMWQRYFEIFLYLPLAFAIPPSIFLAHQMLSTLYQFWIHTALIGRLGFIDYIFNTPSNHRVHHGRNRYCIDKNYAAFLMIWDHLFGTYEAEKDEVVYGLVHPINSFNPVYVQFCHFQYIWNCFWETKGFSNKLSVIFKGPGWTPGQPRLGNPEDIPQITAPMPKYDPFLPIWYKIYTFVHFLLLIGAYQEFAINHKNLDTSSITFFTTLLLISLLSLGAICDNRDYLYFLEASRCLFVVIFWDYFMKQVLASRDLPIIFHQAILVFYLSSCVLWIVQYQLNFHVRIKSKTQG